MTDSKTKRVRPSVQTAKDIKSLRLAVTKMHTEIARVGAMQAELGSKLDLVIGFLYKPVEVPRPADAPSKTPPMKIQLRNQIRERFRDLLPPESAPDEAAESVPEVKSA
ncbi:MAG: hypothetical protein HY650_02255 [Acidobacteria bacterium]|nr:hypothetical protein [Acidobacteriota bacterium]